MKAVVSAAQMRAIDSETIDGIGIPGAVLMENAGRAVAAEVRALQRRGPIAVVCGAGNNGGDGYVIARVLREWGLDASVYLAAAPEHIGGDARTHFDAYRKSGGAVFSVSDSAELGTHRSELRTAEVVVDAVFGTGLDRTVEGHYRDVIEVMNKATGIVVAVDIPSGLSADTGRPLGICARADITVTLAFHKLGTASAPGFAECGRVVVAEIGIPTALAATHDVSARFVEREDVEHVLPTSAALDYKNRRGHLLVVAGSDGKRGAARLTSLAGLRAGAGLVTLASDVADPRIDDSIMTAAATDAGAVLELTSGKACVAIGPGMDAGAGGRALVDGLIDGYDGPLVIDADGLNHLAGRCEKVADAAAAVLTPHPGEAARLLGETSEQVERDRVTAVRRLVDRTQSVCVLKGARTLVGTLDAVFVIPTGAPALATAGSGDVLTGVIAGLLAQGLTPMRAAVAGAYVHGLAGEIGGARLGNRGLIASDLPRLVAEAIASLGQP